MDRVVGGGQGQRNWKDSLILKGKQYKGFLFEQQGEPEKARKGLGGQTRGSRDS